MGNVAGILRDVSRTRKIKAEKVRYIFGAFL